MTPEPLSDQSEVAHGTYRDLDAFQIIEDGRVMVSLDIPLRRLPEEYVPASERDRYRDALRAVWDDMRATDKHFVPNDVLALVRAVIGDELDKHDPASSERTPGRTRDI